MAGKRAMDLVISSLLLIVLSPLMALIALLVKLSSPGPVIFKEKVMGKDGVPFFMYKFRTMYVGRGDSRHRGFIMGFVLENCPYVIKRLGDGEVKI